MWQRFPNLNFFNNLQNGCSSSPNLAIGLGSMRCGCIPAGSSPELDLGRNHYFCVLDHRGTVRHTDGARRAGLWTGSQYGDGAGLE